MSYSIFDEDNSDLKKLLTSILILKRDKSELSPFLNKLFENKKQLDTLSEKLNEGMVNNGLKKAVRMFPVISSLLKMK